MSELEQDNLRGVGRARALYSLVPGFVLHVVAAMMLSANYEYINHVAQAATWVCWFSLIYYLAAGIMQAIISIPNQTDAKP